MNGQAGVRTFVERYPLRPECSPAFAPAFERLKGQSNLNRRAAARTGDRGLRDRKFQRARRLHYVRLTRSV